MLRTHLLTAVAATALLVAPAAFAQTPEQTPATPPTTTAPGVTPQAAPAPTPTPAPVAAPATTPAPAAAAAASAAQANSVIDVLKAQGNFTTLLAALDQAQLTETLASRSAVTVLAPPVVVDVVADHAATSSRARW